MRGWLRRSLHKEKISTYVWKEQIFWKNFWQIFDYLYIKVKFSSPQKNWQKVEGMVEAIAPLQEIYTYL
ncbi:hypothetical protein AFK68_18630 [Hydrocoleum sp. CS-953]|uniref:hypothetical protein n=1 Tax=Hydrocoleum sp. CS-953 TaxID=1671698 RepID=UPI000B9C017F|nr:hypothetical protein [Hydrocoleum sp. CS-953]OZH53287.1 hypothetical protein AFK68_18630 [Hydrocoleum sp. CS-953]